MNPDNESERGYPYVPVSGVLIAHKPSFFLAGADDVPISVELMSMQLVIEFFFELVLLVRFALHPAS